MAPYNSSGNDIYICIYRVGMHVNVFLQTERKGCIKNTKIWKQKELTKHVRRSGSLISDRCQLNDKMLVKTFSKSTHYLTQTVNKP